jgi:hypothetical protein
MLGTDSDASCSCGDAVGREAKPGRNTSINKGTLKMKNTLLLSTAVVLASVGFASAQNAPGNSRDSSAHQGPAQAQQSEQHSSQSQQRNAQGAQKQTGAQNGQHETTGQAPSSAKDQANDKSGQNSAAQSGEHNRNGAQAQQRSEPNQGAGRTNRDANQRTGQQAPNERTGQGSQGAENQGNRNTAQQPQKGNQGNRNAAQPPQQRTGQNEGELDRGNINLSSAQRTKIRDTMLNGRDVPRINNVSFALNVGAAVPSNVRIVEVPETLIEVHPEWRGYSYFVVRDEIVIVDSGRHVVAMVPTGSSSARVEERGGSRNAMNLDRGQIREVQIELQRQGFEIGEPDGMLGPRTKDALMAFQKQRGFQATGEIDHDTFAALGRGQGEGRGQSETTGQAPRNGPPSGAGNDTRSSNPQGGNIPQASENPRGNRPNAGEPRTTGQSSGNQNGRQGNTPSTQGEQRHNENPR